jgi:phage-related protein
MARGPGIKPVVWIGSSLKDFRSFPDEVKSEMGYALFLAQNGGWHRKVKQLKELSPGVIEILDDFQGDTFRTVYSVAFAEAVYVLHAIQKTSKSGIATPKPDIRLIEQRLHDTERLHKESRP